MLGPNLVGDTVRLGPPPEDFAEIVLTWFADPEISRYVILNPLTLAQERQFLARAAANPDMVFWAIWVGDEPIGTTGIRDIDWRNRHGDTGSMIGVAEYRGRGYGTAAHQLRTGYAFEELGLEKLVTTARSDNLPSIRALQRVGYREVGFLRKHTFHDGRWYDTWIDEVLREEWEESEGRIAHGRRP